MQHKAETEAAKQPSTTSVLYFFLNNPINDRHSEGWKWLDGITFCMETKENNTALRWIKIQNDLIKCRMNATFGGPVVNET